MVGGGGGGVAAFPIKEVGCVYEVCTYTRAFRTTLGLGASWEWRRSPGCRMCFRFGTGVSKN